MTEFAQTKSAIAVGGSVVAVIIRRTTDGCSATCELGAPRTTFVGQGESSTDALMDLVKKVRALPSNGLFDRHR